LRTVRVLTEKEKKDSCEGDGNERKDSGSVPIPAFSCEHTHCNGLI